MASVGEPPRPGSLWSPKIARITEAKPENFPATYKENTPKEEVVAEYVTNFRRQFTQLYPQRRHLFLLPLNECSVEKFVCTTVRPIQLPLKELHELNGCASFVSDFIKYEPLPSPIDPPDHLPSPSTILNWQAGDCFDMATVLCSLLLGVGYEAYVVIGKAPQHITVNDMSNTVCEELIEREETEVVEEAPAPSKYRLPERRVLESRFMKAQHARDEAVKQKATPSEVPTEKPSTSNVDEMQGWRVHAWVLVRPGRRGVPAPLFIEPATGRISSPQESGMEGVEAVFNNTNYWANMQDGVDFRDLSYDVEDTSVWEFVLLETSHLNTDTDRTLNHPGDEATQTLDLPPSWTQPASVSKETLNRRWPDGHKSIDYLNATVDLWAEYERKDGMVKRATQYIDASKEEPIKIVESFDHRKDCLRKRTKWILEDKCAEEFDPGRPRALKKHVWISDLWRETDYYPSARADHLTRRTISIGKKMTDSYESRDDGLLYRSVSYSNKVQSPGESVGALSAEPSIVKLTEKFKNMTGSEPEKSVAKRRFHVNSRKIYVEYHRSTGSISAAHRSFNSEGVCTSWTANVHSAELQSREVEDLHNTLLAAERESINAVAEAERENREFLHTREVEEEQLVLTHTVYMPKRLGITKSREARHNAEESAAPERKADYLSPYLVALSPRLAADGGVPGRDRTLSKQEAVQARDACLKALKERLINKANIIQNRLDDETAALTRRQAAFKRNHENFDAEEEEGYVRYCNEAMFRIHILEHRLQRHEENALQKYSEMDGRLRRDPRLAILYQ